MNQTRKDLRPRAAGTEPRKGEPIYRPVMQFMLPSDTHSEDSRKQARSAVLDWAGSARRWRGGWRESIPAEAYEGSPFEAIDDDVHLQVSRDDSGKLWCFHVEHPESGESNRRWKLEAFVADRGTHDEFGVRVFCLADSEAFVPSNTPALVKTFLKNFPLVDGDEIVQEVPLYAESDESYKNFTDLLSAKERTLPVVVVSQSMSRSKKASYHVDPEIIARACQGLAHVVALPAEQTFWLTDDLGKELGVYGGSVRIYQPGFHAHTDKHQHPLYLKERIVVDKTQKSFERALARRLRYWTTDSVEKLERWPYVANAAIATGRTQSLFEGLRRAFGVFRAGSVTRIIATSQAAEEKAAS